MERALKIPEIVSMIVENLSEDPKSRGLPRAVRRTTPFSLDLAQIARVGRIWWEHAMRELYHDIREVHIHSLLKIIHPDWTMFETPDLLSSPFTQQRFLRFLHYMKHVRMVMVLLFEDAKINPSSHNIICRAATFRELARLNALFSPGKPIFPNLEAVSLSVWDHTSLRSSVILLQPRLRWFACVFVVGAIPYVPNFMVAMGKHAPNVTRISFERAIPQEDFPGLAISLRPLRELKEVHLFCPMSSCAVLEALNKLQHLEELSLKLKNIPDKIEQSLCFPTLRGLWLRGDPEAMTGVLDRAEFSQLERLRLTANKQCLDYWEVMLATLERRMPDLTCLSVDIEALPDGDEQPLGFNRDTADFLPFGALPNLNYLFIWENRLKLLPFPGAPFGIDDKTLRRAQADWPNLETFGVEHATWVWTDVIPPRGVVVRSDHGTGDPATAKVGIDAVNGPNLIAPRPANEHGCCEIRLSQAREGIRLSRSEKLSRQGSILCDDGMGGKGGSYS